MWRIIRIAVLTISSAIVFISVPITAAQQASDSAPAPIPVQILTGKTAFISNRGSNVAPVDAIPLDHPYNEFYSSMKSWGRYELVSSPTEADLVLEIRLRAVIAGESTRDRVYAEPQLSLVIVDPKTHAVLWTFTERIEGAFLKTTLRKNYDKSIAALVGDLKRLTVPQLSAHPQ